MTRKREPRVPKATCCSLALASWRGGPCLILCCAWAPAHCLHRQQWLFWWSLGLLEAYITGHIHWSNISLYMSFIYSAGNELRKCHIRSNKKDLAQEWSNNQSRPWIHTEPGGCDMLGVALSDGSPVMCCSLISTISIKVGNLSGNSAGWIWFNDVLEDMKALTAFGGSQYKSGAKI